jgi:hypothetical protein
MGQLTPEQIAAWRDMALILIETGKQAVATVRSWFGVVHPEMTPEQLEAAWQQVLDEDRVRLAISLAAAGLTDAGAADSSGN